MGHHSADCVLVMAVVALLVLLLVCLGGRGDWGGAGGAGGLPPARAGFAPIPPGGLPPGWGPTPLTPSENVSPAASNCFYGPYAEESVLCSYNYRHA